MTAARRLALGPVAVAVLVLALIAVRPAAASAAPRTHWLCRPGMRHDPCTPGLATTSFSPTGTRLGVDHVRRAHHPRIDCFYVYPTVSDQPTPAATLHVDPEERSIALYQAAYYSQECRVFAPMYRQITLAGLFDDTATTAMRDRAYADVRRAWRDYLRHHNHGRGVVLIGHSQGSFVLRQLVSEEIDPKRAVRRRLVSAILLGGNVTVKRGRDRGGDFHHVRACRSARQVGCVVAFSTYGAQPPSNSLFGRTTAPGLQVLCTNPAALRGGSARLHPVFPRAPFAPGTTIGTATLAVGVPVPSASTPWIASPGSYRARCSSAGGADVLRITPRHGAPALDAVPDATWGLHLVDANIALGDLVRLVRRQAAVYAHARG